ncbi:MAG: DUF1549 domain-containing protein [Planctomycetaceae bacterium]|nr:DUF1549 domain-containing protein [Planctomycetaceae bacterium]
MSWSDSHIQLHQLADRICEGTLTQADCDQLQQLIAQQPQLAEQLVRHLEVHTLLYWDLGQTVPSLFDEETSDRSAQELALEHDLELEASRSREAFQILLDDLLTEAGLSDPEIYTTLPTPVEKPDRRRIFAILTTSCLFLVGLFAFLFNQQGTAPPKPENEQVQVDAKSDRPNKQDPHQTDPVVDPVLVSEDENPPELPPFEWGSPHHSPAVADNNPETKDPSKIKPAAPGRAILNDVELVDEINRLLKEGWKDWEVSPSPQAEDHEWIRRVYLDLAGRIPHESEVSAYLADDRADKDQRLIDSLLGSSDFALNWSTRWTHHLVGRVPPEHVDQVALQKFLIDGLHSTAQWDQMVKELIAAQGRPHENGAVNFLMAHLNNQAVPATAYVARTLMGFQIQCAQCHNHPFYAMNQQQFWEFNSFFKQAVITRTRTQDDQDKAETDYELRDREFTGPTYYESRQGTMHVAYSRFNGQEINDEGEESRRQKLGELLVEGDEPLVAQAFVNRVWAHLFGYGFTAPVDDLGPHNPPSHPELFATLTRSFVASGYDITRLYRWIALSDAYHLSSSTHDGNQSDTPETGQLPAFSRMYPKQLSPEELYNSLVVLNEGKLSSGRQWPAYVAERDDWVSQFIVSHENDENDEENHFDGSVTQALVLMNNEFIQQTVSPESNPQFSHLLTDTGSDQDKFERICLAVLSREPTAREAVFFRSITGKLREADTDREREQILSTRLSDVYWAYLNSSEFIVNH